MHNFQIGQLYNRQKQIHDVYGGIRQTGISPSNKSPFIFVFTGALGSEYGYEDGWDEETGLFYYTGEGKKGDMSFSHGNKALCDHQIDGRDLLLFEQLGKGKPYRFLGEFACVSYEEKTITDQNKENRKGLIFHLLNVDEEVIETESATKDTNQELTYLREKAYNSARNAIKQSPSTGKTTYYKRSQDIKDYVLARSNGKCECCGEPAPFNKKDGTPYLEPHHIYKLSDKGLDHPKMMAALTPNCHRKVHFSVEGANIDKKLERIIYEKELRND